MDKPIAWIKARELTYMKAVVEHGATEWKTNLGLKPEDGDVPLYTAPPQQPEPEQEIDPDRPHVEDDGCPTEKAVLQRFWREHQAQPEQEQCHHKFEIDQEAPSHSCCQMCGEVRKQPEQEPVAWITTWNEPNDAGVELHWAKQDKGLSSKHTPLFYKSTMNTDSKPVGWLYQTNNTWEQFSFIEPPDDAYDEGSLRPVYTAPPQRDEAPAKAVEWQGLTDHEIVGIASLNQSNDFSFARAIETKLKAKNA